MTADLVIRDEQHYLATVSEIRTLVERIESVEEVKDLADRAAAAKVWAQRARLGADQVNLASIARLWAERRAGELLAAGGVMTGRRGKESPFPTLSDLGITRDESSEYQRLAAVPAEEFQEAIEAVREEGPVSRAKVMAVHYSSETDLWSTPQDLYEALGAEFAIATDVCATSENAKCDRFFSPEDDGLAQEWTGACWMNPPYGREIGKWVSKARAAADAGAVIVCLLPARTDTGWWWDHCRFGEIRFLRGRLRFGGGDTGAPFPSAVVIFGRPAAVVWWERGE